MASRTDEVLRLRLDAETKRMIQDAARTNHRTMQSEIEHRLKASFLVVEEDPRSVAQRLDRLEHLIKHLLPESN